MEGWARPKKRMMPGRIKDGGYDEVCCLFWLFLRQSGATVVLPTVGTGITPPIIMVAITIIGALDGDTVIARGGGARRINDPDFGRLPPSGSQIA